MQYSLKAIRVNKGESQKEAAKALGIRIETLDNYERGITYPDIPVIKKIEEHYGIGYNDIDFFANILQLNSKNKRESKKIAG